MTLRRSGGSERNPNKRLQRTGISVSLIDNLSHDVVVSRPLKRSVRRPPCGEVQDKLALAVEGSQRSACE